MVSALRRVPWIFGHYHISFDEVLYRGQQTEAHFILFG
jgi:hypothetical protein